MIKALLHIFDWQHNCVADQKHEPVLAADLAREFRARHVAVRQSLKALNHTPVSYKSQRMGKIAYRQWWFAPQAVIRRPKRGRPEAALGENNRILNQYLYPLQ